MASKFSNMAFYTTAKLLSSAGTGDTVTISNDVERDASVTLTDSAQVLFTSLDGTSIERMTVTTTGGTLTIVERGLDQSASPSEVSALMKEWKSGTLVKVVHAAADIVDVNADNTFTGDNDFTGDCTFTKTLKEPVYATTAARDAVTSSDWDVCYVTAEGSFYDKTSWSRIVREWWWTFFNASTTVAGKVEIATTAESIAASSDTWGTGANLIVLPSDIAANTQSDTFKYAADAGASDTYAITLVPAIASYTTWQMIRFKANTINTWACTLNVNAKWAKSIKTNLWLDLKDWDIAAGEIIEVIYDGTDMIIQKDLESIVYLWDGNDWVTAVTSGTTTLTEDLYATTLSISAWATLDTAWFRVYARTSITNAGTIHNNWGDWWNGWNGGATWTGNPWLAWTWWVAGGGVTVPLNTDWSLGGAGHAVWVAWVAKSHCLNTNNSSAGWAGWDTWSAGGSWATSTDRVHPIVAVETWYGLIDLGGASVAYYNVSATAWWWWGWANWDWDSSWGGWGGWGWVWGIIRLISPIITNTWTIESKAWAWWAGWNQSGTTAGGWWGWGWGNGGVIIVISKNITIGTTDVTGWVWWTAGTWSWTAAVAGTAGSDWVVIQVGL